MSPPVRACALIAALALASPAAAAQLRSCVHDEDDEALADFAGYLALTLDELHASP